MKCVECEQDVEVSVKRQVEVVESDHPLAGESEVSEQIWLECECTAMKVTEKGHRISEIPEEWHEA